MWCFYQFWHWVLSPTQGMLFVTWRYLESWLPPPSHQHVLDRSPLISSSPLPSFPSSWQMALWAAPGSSIQEPNTSFLFHSQACIIFCSKSYDYYTGRSSPNVSIKYYMPLARKVGEKASSPQEVISACVDVKSRGWGIHCLHIQVWPRLVGKWKRK